MQGQFDPLTLWAGLRGLDGISEIEVCLIASSDVMEPHLTYIIPSLTLNRRPPATASVTVPALGRRTYLTEERYEL